MFSRTKWGLGPTMLHLANNWKSCHLLTKKAIVKQTATTPRNVVVDIKDISGAVDVTGDVNHDDINDAIKDDVIIDSQKLFDKDEKKEKRIEAMVLLLRDEIYRIAHTDKC